MKRPRHIDQVVHVLADKDAIGSHVINTQSLLHTLGFESDIYASEAHPEVQHLAKPMEELAAHGRDRWILIHHSTGAIAADVVKRRPEPKLIDYHNVTPAHLVSTWAPWVREELELGVEQLNELAPVSFFGVAHSKFSEAELRHAGCSTTVVAPPIVDTMDPSRSANARLVTLREAERSVGGSDWLFVGRISPHKAQHDLIKAFVCYREFFDPMARLHLVGSSLGDDYPRSLMRFTTRLGLDDAVRMPGSISNEELSALYSTSDVFVCLSDHEGFCVPLVEAMRFGVPVVAFNSSAVGETVGNGGIVLADKAPMAVATAAFRVVSDPEVRRTMIAAGRRRAACFSREAGRRRWIEVIELALDVAEGTSVT